jgi:hypothetical protein
MLKLAHAITHIFLVQLRHTKHVLRETVIHTHPLPPHHRSQVRDIDLDMLEKIVSIIAYGDIEAEDTRHLTELNFLKVLTSRTLGLVGFYTCLSSCAIFLGPRRWQGISQSCYMLHIGFYFSASGIPLVPAHH